MIKVNALPGIHRLFAIVALAALVAGCIPQAVAPPTGAPANLVAVAGNGSVNLTWAASTGATGYSVKRSTTSGGPYSALATVTSTSYADVSVTNDTTYYYVVSAFNDGGGTANSTEVTATPEVPRAPVAPTNLSAQVGNQSITLAWTASARATSYRVKRATVSGGPYTQVGTPTSTGFVDSPLVNGQVYYYVVSAVNTIGESANSSQVSASPSPPPPTTFGTWTDVTPAGVNLSASVGCGNPGTSSVQSDPGNPGHVYVQFSCQGIWRSVDYGLTWSGPINTGTNGAAAAICEGGIAVASNGQGTVPTIYQSCIRGSAIGFWKSTNGGVGWTQYAVTPTVRQDYLPPVVDPYDNNHLLMSAHEFDSVVESTDGGATWHSVAINGGMTLNGLNSFIFFINTGSASTTRNNWLWMAGGGGGGTWRTTNGGSTWARVDGNESQVGATQIYQPDNSGIVFMAGVRSDLGWGVLRSTDCGFTWTRVGISSSESTVFGTSKNVYTMNGLTDKNFNVASQPGTGTWVTAPTPSSLPNGAARVAVISNGSSSILLGAMWEAGLWRYIEP